MTLEILIGLGGLTLSIFTYFAGIRRAEKRLSTEERAARIKRVFEKYMEFRKTNYTGGLHGLQKAGVATLASDNEIRELISLIIKHGEMNPIGGIENIDLKLFFDYAVNNQIDFMSTEVETMVNKIKSKKNIKSRKNTNLFNIILRKGMNFFGYLGAIFVTYAILGIWLGFNFVELEKIMIPASYYLTLSGVILTCTTAYFYKGNPHPPERFSKYISAPIVIIACFLAAWFYARTGTLPNLVINGLVMLGLAGAFFRIQPATAE